MLTPNISADYHKYLNERETSVLKYLPIASIHNRIPPAFSPLEVCAIVDPNKSPLYLHTVNNAVYSW